eukprot:1330304-Rhodomonas_salina.1
MSVDGLGLLAETDTHFVGSLRLVAAFAALAAVALCGTAISRVKSVSLMSRSPLVQLVDVQSAQAPILFRGPQGQLFALRQEPQSLIDNGCKHKCAAEYLACTIHLGCGDDCHDDCQEEANDCVAAC